MSKGRGYRDLIGTCNSSPFGIPAFEKYYDFLSRHMTRVLCYITRNKITGIICYCFITTKYGSNFAKLQKVLLIL